MARQANRGPLYEDGRLTARPDLSATSAEAPRPGRHALGLAGERDGALLVPPAATAGVAVPLVVALHGAGGVTAQMLDLLQSVAETRGVAVLAPESRGQTWDVIRGGFGPDVAFIDQALRATFGHLAIDSSRVALAGFSDGASYALSLGVANGSLFSDVLAFSPGFIAAPDQEGSPRIFISHGCRDEVLPIDRCSRRLAPALEASGYDTEYVEFDGGHVVPAAMVERAFARLLN